MEYSWKYPVNVLDGSQWKVLDGIQWNILENIQWNVLNGIQSNVLMFKGTHEQTYYLNKIVGSKFAFKYFEEDMKRTVINLPNKSSCGYGGLSNKLLTFLSHH